MLTQYTRASTKEGLHEAIYEDHWLLGLSILLPVFLQIFLGVNMGFLHWKFMACFPMKTSHKLPNNGCKCTVVCRCMEAMTIENMKYLKSCTPPSLVCMTFVHE